MSRRGVQVTVDASENRGVGRSQKGDPRSEAAGELATSLPVTGAVDVEERLQRLKEVLRRLREGELDTDLAAVETALALLDGDSPEV